MNDEIIKTVLTELSEEIKKFKDDILMLNKSNEVLTERISSFEDFIGNMKITIPRIDTENLSRTLTIWTNEIKEIVTIKPKPKTFQLKDSHRIFLKKLINRTILYSFLGLTICGITWLLSDFYKKNSKNERLKYSLYWHYNHSSREEKKRIDKTVSEFYNDSIYNERRNKYSGDE